MTYSPLRDPNFKVGVHDAASADACTGVRGPYSSVALSLALAAAAVAAGETSEGQPFDRDQDWESIQELRTALMVWMQNYEARSSHGETPESQLGARGGASARRSRRAAPRLRGPSK